MSLNTSILCLDLRAAMAGTASASADALIDIGTCTDAGRVRENNEDSLRAAPEMNLFVVSDGMGGMACGEVASRLTADTLLAHCREAEAEPSLALAGERVAGLSQTSNRLASGIRLANSVVYREARQNAACRGMGATVAAVQWTNDRLSVAHVGDSRVYRLRNERLEQLTQDHSFAAEQMRLGQINAQQASTGGLQNILTRAVGIEPEVEAEISEDSMSDGDTLLLCSDGLTHELSDRQVGAILRDAKSAQDAATQLVEMANQAGGADNITAIVIRQVSKAAGVLSNMGRLGRWFNARS